jgi:nitric oxide reductase subunit B
MRRLWITLGVVVVFEFVVLGWIGTRIYQEKPPIPGRVVTTDEREVVGAGEIMRRQHVWQTMGGMEI